MKIAVIVSSCYKFYEKTVDNLLKDNIPPENVLVVIGESPFETNVIKHKNYNIAFCRYYNIDYNAAIYITQNYFGKKFLKDFTHFFYTPDTAEFLPHFWETIQKIHTNSYIKIQPQFTKNIGFFNTQWFISKKTDFFKHLINYDPKYLLEVKGGHFNKEYIHTIFNNLPEWLNEDAFFIFDTFKPTGEYFINEPKSYFVKKYSSEDRLATVYIKPGIIKFQKNIGNGEWNLTL